MVGWQSALLYQSWKLAIVWRVRSVGWNPDSQLNKNRIAIPDFYIPDKNLIVEIKSSWTLNIKNMKDKFNEYKNLGYNVKLILNKQEVDLYSL